MRELSTNLIWIDLEMTGLRPFENRIIEIATVITDSDLKILAEGPVIAINQAEPELTKMDEWNTLQHARSGLIDRVRKSSICEIVAMNATLDFLGKWVDFQASPMCGNSICLDRRFLFRYMPQLANFFHYRNIDVSTLKELVQRWKPSLMSGFNKKAKHLALDDIYDSIAELKFYRDTFINI